MADKYLTATGDFEAVAVRPDGGWLSKSRDKGTPCVQIVLRVVNDDRNEGKLITWYGWLSDKAFTNTVRKLREVFNFDGDFDELIRGGSTFAGMPCRFTAESEEYQGKERVKVKWLNRHDYEPSAPAIDQSEALTFAASFTRKAKAALKEEGEPAAASTPKAPAPPEDDDVPF